MEKRYHVMRIRPSYILLVEYFELRAKRKGPEAEKEIHEEIFTYGLNQLNAANLDPTTFNYEIESAPTKTRKGKGFLLEDKTNSLYNTYSKIVKDYRKSQDVIIYKGEIAEVIIYLYAIDHMSKEEIIMLDMHFCVTKCN